MPSTKNALTYVREYFEEKAGESIADEELYDYLISKPLKRVEVTAPHRWWNDTFVATEIGGKMIGFCGAETTGDHSPRDVGWEFDAGSICYAEARIKTVTEYAPIHEDK